MVCYLRGGEPYSSVYLLRDSDTCEVRYVGMTYVWAPKRRWALHERSTKPIAEWIGSGGRHAWQVVARFYSEHQKAMAYALESHLTKTYRARGDRLFNGFTSGTPMYRRCATCNAAAEVNA